jgi:hypothetical protein
MYLQKVRRQKSWEKILFLVDVLKVTDENSRIRICIQILIRIRVRIH